MKYVSRLITILRRETFSQIYQNLLIKPEGLFLKVNRNDISETLLRILRDYSRCRKQRVFLNGQHSSWNNVNAGVPRALS